MAEQIDARTFRHVLGQFCTGITIITQRARRRPRGLRVPVVCGAVVGAAARASVRPSVALVEGHRGQRELLRQRVDGESKGRIGAVRLEGAGQVRRLSTGAHRLWARPSSTESLAYIDCTVASVHDGGDHFVVFGAVKSLSEVPKINRDHCCSTAATTPASSRIRPRRRSGVMTWRRF